MTERRCVDCGVDIKSKRSPRCQACRRVHDLAKKRKWYDENRESQLSYEKTVRDKRRSEAQSSARCKSCGAKRESTLSLRCNKCRMDRRRENQRRWRGTTIRERLPCVNCGKSRQSSKSTRCPLCRRQHDLKTQRDSATRRRLADPSTHRDRCLRTRAAYRDRYLHREKASRQLKFADKRSQLLARPCISCGVAVQSLRAVRCPTCRKAWNNKTTKQWRADNPEKVQAHGVRHEGRRRAQKLNQLGFVSKDICEQLLKQQGGKCAGTHCRKALGSRKAWHLDHIMPLALGGLHDDANLQILCAHCNLSKNAKHHDDWLTEHGELPA